MTLQHDGHDYWHELYNQERERLLAALGRVSNGGIVESVQHIGATSVPGVPAIPCVDMILAVSPFPLESLHVETLAALGYMPLSREEESPEQCFRHRADPVQLIFVEAGSDFVTEALIFRMISTVYFPIFLQTAGPGCAGR